VSPVEVDSKLVERRQLSYM